MGEWKAVHDIRSLKERENIPFSEWPIELYNLSTDIGEENNVADQHPEIVRNARHIMEKARVSLGPGN